MFTCIKQTRVEILKQFLNLVLMQFIEENARSHSAELTGMSAPIVASFASCGNISHNEWSVYKLLAHRLGCIVVLDQPLKAFPLTGKLLSINNRIKSFAVCSREYFHLILAICG